MNIDALAKRFAELGHSTRLRVYHHLVKGGHDGVPVGELQSKFGVPNSTLSHHLNRLIKVGLIEQRREGTTLYCVPVYDELFQMTAFLQEECCVNECEDTAKSA